MQSLEGLRLMSALSSRGYCAIARYISMQDPLAEALRDGGDEQDPHQGREEAWAIFNLLWLEGWQPEITYLHRVFDRPITEEQALARYNMYVKKYDPVSLRQKLGQFKNEDGLIVTKSETLLALITWSVSSSPYS